MPCPRPCTRYTAGTDPVRGRGGHLGDRSGVPARVVDPREIEFVVSGAALDSDPVSVDTARLHALSAQWPVLIIPGFFGIGGDGRVQLLGRGGSNLSAIFFAIQLRAVQCRLVKDVDGNYDTDPALARQRIPQRFATLNHADASEFAGCSAPPVAPRLRAILLGLGTVGFGVHRRLIADSERVDVVAALVRSPDTHVAHDVPPHLLLTDPHELRTRSARHQRHLQFRARLLRRGHLAHECHRASAAARLCRGGPFR